MSERVLENYLVWGLLGVLFLILGAMLVQVFNTFRAK